MANPRLKDKYLSEIVPALKDKFQYKSIMQVPKIEKIAKNMFIFCDGMIIALAFFSDLKIQFRWAEIERLEYLKRLVRFLNKEF